MSTPIGEFLQSALGSVKLPGKTEDEQIEQSLIAEFYVRVLGRRLSELPARDVYGDIGRLIDPHAFERILLRYDARQSEKWRLYLEGLGPRMDEEEKKTLDRFLKKLPEKDGTLPSDHPIKLILIKTRAVVRARRDRGRLPESDDEKRLYDDLDKALELPATRQWLCLATRRMIHGRS